MNIKEELTNSLVKHMLGNFGFVDPPLFGKVGLSEFLLKTKDNITIKYENEIEKKYPVYAGELNLKDGLLKSIGTYVHFNDDPSEFIVLFKLNNNEITAIKKVEDECLFLTSSNGVDWEYATMYQKLMACAGLEYLTNTGYNWSPCLSYLDLMQPLREIVEL